MAQVDQIGGADADDKLRPGDSLVRRAMAGDHQAMETMFRAFLPDGERLLISEYLGVRGLFGLGEKCFGCVTDSRVARLEVGFLGKVEYQEALIRDINSILVVQPSRLSLYLIFAVIVLMAIPTLGFALLAIPFAPRVYYRFVKSGMVLGVREGLLLYAFADRARLPRVRALLGEFTPRR